MSDELKDTTQPTEEEYQLSFKNGALANIKSLASVFDISEDNLQNVINKAISLLSVVKDSEFVYFEKNGERYKVNIRKL